VRPSLASRSTCLSRLESAVFNSASVTYLLTG
jgi:hypothetical protein